MLLGTLYSLGLRSCFIPRLDSCGKAYLYRALDTINDERQVHTTLLLSLQDHNEQRLCPEDTIELSHNLTLLPFRLHLHHRCPTTIAD